ncbi:MAG: SH3 domain-containing protein [Spirochaetaceae bacterium]|nr:SH3 domain-containing protein [Spirochaetaceae bacterium]
MSKRTIGLFFILILLVTGCSNRKLGYGVLLWSDREHGLLDGEIVPVYVKSNISNSYIIGTDSSKEKFEVPLWQLTEPESKRKVVKTAEKFLDYQHQYARVVLDGLPIREEPVNLSKQVYRLRKDEVIKVLYKGKGSDVMSGSSKMEGDWLRVLTSDGTQGWCFSYNLRLFDIRDSQQQEQNVEKEEEVIDEALESALLKKWYPESYASMIDSNRIDLSFFERRYGFDTGKESNTVTLKLPGITVSFPFAGIESIGTKQYKFVGTPIEMTIKSENYIVVSYTDEKGKPTFYNLVTIPSEIEEIISEEVGRREQLYAQLEAFGPSFSSSNYGDLTFTGSNSFTWSGFKQLQPSVIPNSVLGRGIISFDLFLSKSLQMNYDGVICFNFENSTKGINFLYKIEENGLRLETTEGSTIRNGILSSRSSSPVVIFFGK